MEEFTTQTPKPNEFVIPEYEGYAAFDIETSEVAEFLMTKLEPVKLEDLDADDRVCAICQADFFDSDDVHIAVKTVCGHVFGKHCIMRWLQPLGPWDLDEDDDLDSDPDFPWIKLGKSSCPMCRQDFFPKCSLLPIDFVAELLSFWDMAYASAGVARSEREERSRKYLRQYIEYCRSINQYERNWTAEEFFTSSGRRKLDRIANVDLSKCAFENGSYVFNIDHDDESVELEHHSVETETQSSWETETEEDDHLLG
ncbi:hypothetical protein MMC07_004630 [Pseudocyphellaria aurata]|nr:hypothetical protein [Pseudocyphellaria aurata]